MKRTFIIFSLACIDLHAAQGNTHHVLKMVSMGTTVWAIAQYADLIIDAQTIRRDIQSTSLDCRPPYIVLLDERNQACARPRLHQIYRPHKPLYLGINLLGHYGSWDLSDAHVITLDSRDFPEGKLNELAPADITRCMDRHMTIIAHELGHIKYGHTQKKYDHQLASGTVLAALATYASVRHLRANYRPQAVPRSMLTRIAGLIALVPLTQLTHAYYNAVISRSHEREADAFAHEHSTVAQLQQARADLQADIHTSPHMKDFLSQIVSEQFMDHPSPAQRIAAIEHAIAQKK